ncbi:MAG: DNA repair protein RadC [Dehalococcoidia bacterium]
MNGHEGASYTLIRDLPAGDRPRERLRDFGAHALSNAELLAILLRTGSSKESALAQATRILARFEGLPGLAHAAFAELCAEKGLGEAKASQVKAALELGIRVASSSPDQRPAVASPEDIANLVLAEMSLLEQEHVRVMLVDTRNRVMGIHEAYRGSVHTTAVRIAELLREPVRANAAAMVLVHNHPSGDATPSADDIRMTKALFDAAALMGIDLLDHVVVGGGRFVSMHRLGLGFPRSTSDG